MSDQFTEDSSSISTADGYATLIPRKANVSFEDYRDKCQKFVDFYRYAQRALKDKHDQWILWWNRYHGDNSGIISRMSKEEREWRAAILVPWDYSGIQTIVAHMLDIIRSVTPPVQAQGVGVEDADAAAMENLFEYTLRMCDFEGFAQDVITRACVQGVAYAKLVYAEQCHVYNFRPSQRDILLFDQAIQQAQSILKTEAPIEDAMALNEWMRNAKNIIPGLDMPPIPVIGPKKVYTFRGPMLSAEVNGFDLFYDPTVRNLQKQDIIIHRIYQAREWVEEQTESDDGKPPRFDAKAVEESRNAARSTKMSQETKAVLDANKLGQVGGESNPFSRQVDEILEVWCPEMDPPYAVLLNETPIPINTNLGEYPYEHGGQPFFGINNVPSQFDATGMSEYQRTSSLYEEADRIRSCHADSVALATYPAWKKKGGYGLSSGVKQPRPGRVFEVADLNDMQPLFSTDKQIAIGMGQLQFTQAETDDTHGTYSSVRGAPGMVSRVSATEQSGRLRSTQTRMALRVGNFERGLNPSLVQILALWAQFGSDDALRNIGGGKNPVSQIRRDQLIEGIQQDYRFVFSAQSQDPSMEIQQTGQILQMFQGLIQPPGMMELLSQLLSKLRFKNIEKITSVAPPPAEAQPPMPGESDMAMADQQGHQDDAQLQDAAEQDGMQQAQEEVAQ